MLKIEDFTIYVSSPHFFQVYYKGRGVSNWQDLMDEAQEVTEPLLRKRWALFWKLIIRKVVMLDPEHGPLTEIMSVPQVPGDYYACPIALAAKAVVEVE